MICRFEEQIYGNGVSRTSYRWAHDCKASTRARTSGANEGSSNKVGTKTATSSTSGSTVGFVVQMSPQIRACRSWRWPLDSGRGLCEVGRLVAQCVYYVNRCSILSRATQTQSTGVYLPFLGEP